MNAVDALLAVVVLLAITAVIAVVVRRSTGVCLGCQVYVLLRAGLIPGRTRTA